MAVPRNKRTLSDIEYFHNGIKMRDAVLDILIRDFGVRIKKGDFRAIQKMHNINEEDMEIVEYICKKYRVGEHILYNFPGWFLEYERKYIMDSLRKFLMHIRYADAIHVKSDKMHEYRRYHIIQARTECFLIMDEMDYIVKVYNVDMNTYLPLLDIIHYEINLLNRLEKLDNDRYRKWKKRESKKEPQHTPTNLISDPPIINQKPITTPFDD